MANILFAMRHPGYVRMYESTIIELSNRGHSITLDFVDSKEKRIATPLGRLERDVPSLKLRADGSLSRGKDTWVPVANALRMAIDLSRYADPRYAQADLLRDRVVEKFEALPIPASTRVADRILNLGGEWSRTRFQNAAIRMDAAIPLTENIIDTLERTRPDIVIVTPLVDVGSRQVDVVRHAQALGIPVAVAVASWDNLTNKGLMRCQPDRIFVWNEAQRQEAIEMHGIDGDTVCVTGAQVFDVWFDWRPIRTREEFMRDAGLDASQPYFLWLSSSNFIGGDREVEYVLRWLGRLREHSDTLRDVGVMVRPHPQATGPWVSVELSKNGNAVIFPRLGVNPVDSNSRQDFFESIYYSEGVIGINSSAMIESAIVGKPVFTVIAEEFAGVQGGTLHFSHLEDALLHRAESDTELFDLLDQALENPADFLSKNESFLKSFIRPHGLDVAANDLLVAEIEALADQPRKTPDPSRLGDPLRRVVLHATKAAINSEARKRKKMIGADPSTFPIVSIREHQASGLRARRRRGNAEFDWQNHVVQTNEAVVTDEEVFEIAELTKEETALTLVRQVVEPARLDLEFNAQFKKIARGDNLVVVGPWTSELGFELLYWIPYLRWLQQEHGLDPGRVVSLTRGGAGPAFYGDIAHRHVDIFDLMDHQEFRDKFMSRLASRGTQKQKVWSTLDGELVELAGKKLGTQNLDIIHPSTMYRYFAAFWKDRLPVRALRDRTLFTPFEPPELSDSLAARLPSEFDVVRFYFRPSFPDTPDNRAFISSLVGRLVKKRPVVVLATGMRFDDHAEHRYAGEGDIVYIDDEMTPENNLLVQAAVISRANAFYGTYGGLAYLPAYYGVPSYSFYSELDHFSGIHFQVAGIQSTALGTLSHCLDVNLPLWSN